MPDPIFELHDVSLMRGQQMALQSVTLDVQRGEVLVVIGASGSGKSSLLRCFNRLETVQEGKICFNGQDINQLSVLELRRQVGMVFQKTAVFEGTVSDNIAYGQRLRKQDLSRIELLDLMEQVALPVELIDRDASELSGGQEQRLSIARALANQPQVLLVDEPTSALDPVITHKIEDVLLKRRDKTGLTLIWVSHDAEQAQRIADRVLLLDKGQVVRCDTVDAMLHPEHGDKRVLAFARGLSSEES